ncbi:MAG: ATP-binding cassette domain-containing protein, partial [Bifidobacteriaceae bacterium]|nr:ATP-binding cassette domain-containing protein [Bifidobacteriaceae bacterium]
MTASEPIIRFDGVSAGWIEDCPVVQDLTLAFDSPGVTALTGRNGTGKSTVVELISGYLRPWTGAVEVNGFSAQSAAARAKRRVCRTAPALFSLMTVRDHLVLSARSAGCDVDA